MSSVAFSPDGRWLVSGSWSKDATVRLWDLQHPEPTGKIVGKILWQHRNLETDTVESITSVAFSPDGQKQKLASGSYDKTIRLWDLNHLDQDPIVLRGYKQSVTSVAFYPDGKKLVNMGL